MNDLGRLAGQQFEHLGIAQLKIILRVDAEHRQHADDLSRLVAYRSRNRLVWHRSMRAVERQPVGDQRAAMQLRARHQVPVHLREQQALRRGLAFTRMTKREIAGGQEDGAHRSRQAFDRYFGYLRKGPRAVGRARFGKALEQSEVAAVVGEILVQLTDGGARSSTRAQFVLQTVERRLDQRMQGAQALIGPGTGGRGRGHEPQNLVQAAPDTKSIACLGLENGHTVDIAVSAGREGGERCQRGLQAPGRTRIARPQRLCIGTGEHDLRDSRTESPEQLRVRRPSVDRGWHARQHRGSASGNLGHAQHFLSCDITPLRAAAPKDHGLPFSQTFGSTGLRPSRN